MIRVLCADISAADQHIYDRLYHRASPERKRRADRYLRPADKLRCVAADALLKAALGTDAYQVVESADGKPCIQDRPDFHYNLSHSGDYVVIAWGDSEVGVDVQRHEECTNTDAIAERFFAPDELEYIRTDAAQARPRFYEIWTKKESWLKYTGKGLRTDLRSFSVLAPEGQMRYQYRTLTGGYSLCLCTTDKESTFELLDVQQLL